jgi:transcription termination/antitermination protein NusG
LPTIAACRLEGPEWQTDRQEGGNGSAALAWHVLWTHSHCEQLVYDQLSVKGFHLFLPKIDVWSNRRGVRSLSRAPMFPGYLFIKHAMDKKSYIEVCKARGLAQLLGQGWDRLAAVPDKEIEAIQTVNRASLPVLPHPYLREGQRVRITGGLLAGVEGIFLRSKPTKGLLVIAIDLLRRSVAVEVDVTMVEAL